MSSLYLIRHGQASFFAKEYDCLSKVGTEQARCLGRFWSESGLTLDEMITGPRERHRGTATLALETMRAAGLSCGCVREEAALDENQLELLLRETRGAPFSTDAMEAAARDGAGKPEWSQRDELRQFRDTLEEVTTRWLEGAPGTENIESWPAFRSRVRAALAQILERKGRGRKVAVITSAGVIGAVLQTALGCSDAHAMALSRRLRNASLSEFVFSGGRFTLDSFNALPHLPDRQLWTYL